ncbi:hypothetical protein CPSG_00968 [Coccidioides posadasii str. Silveira]|uniref:Uncharacterized protein n=1 Tax=Coccidioides posadasii (strain RMSCC 757 / Silveira) TaxID=443226 RepID=E9CU33_COCPS|nr:hypothetical protein CPSG_00968 [Coccidioides posadasii str. Silveira]
MPRGEVAGTRQRQRQRERGLKVFGHNREGLGGKTAVGRLGTSEARGGSPRGAHARAVGTVDGWTESITAPSFTCCGEAPPARPQASFSLAFRDELRQRRDGVDEAEYNTVPPQHVGRRSQSPFTGWPPVSCEQPRGLWFQLAKGGARFDTEDAQGSLKSKPNEKLA